MSTRKQAFRAESEGVDRMAGWPLAVHEPECIGVGVKAQYTGQCDCRTIRMLVIEVMRERLTVAESRVAELEATVKGSEALPEKWDSTRCGVRGPGLRKAAGDLRDVLAPPAEQGHIEGGLVTDEDSRGPRFVPDAVPALCHCGDEIPEEPT